jgi:hypothetical protein
MLGYYNLNCLISSIPLPPCPAGYFFKSLYYFGISISTWIVTLSYFFREPSFLPHFWDESMRRVFPIGSSKNFLCPFLSSSICGCFFGKTLSSRLTSLDSPWMNYFMPPIQYNSTLHFSFLPEIDLKFNLRMFFRKDSSLSSYFFGLILNELFHPTNNPVPTLLHFSFLSEIDLKFNLRMFFRKESSLSSYFFGLISSLIPSLRPSDLTSWSTLLHLSLLTLSFSFYPSLHSHSLLHPPLASSPSHSFVTSSSSSGSLIAFTPSTS